MIIPITHNPNNKFTVARLHFSLDPDKNTPEWITEAKRGMPENGFMREYEIDYSFFAGKPFFPEFKEHNISLKPIEYENGETLYRGWDYGFHRPCCVITRLNEKDQWCWVKGILGQDEGILDFGKRVRRYCLGEYPGAKYIDAADIAGTQVTDKSEQTSTQILNMLGIYPQFRKQEIKQGAEIIRQKLKMRVDGIPGILIDPSQTDLIDMMKGGLHYADAKEGQEKEVYEKDGYFDHQADSLRYLATEMFTIIGTTQQTNEIAQNDLEHQWRDGRPRQTLDSNDIDEPRYDDGAGLLGMDDGGV